MQTEFSSNLLDAITNAQHIAVLTGAGVSAESGIPTFRDAQTGLWANYRAEDLATPEAFERDPDFVWEWYEFRRKLISETSPNPGHQALYQLSQRAKQFSLITQNVDDLHERAGHQDVLHVHGSIFQAYRTDRPVANQTPTYFSYPATTMPPKDTEDGVLLRPGVVWFGEMLPEHIWEQSIQAAESCDVFIVVGTSGLVQPAASLPFTAKYSGALVIEANTEPSAITDVVDYFLEGAAGEVLPALLKALSS